MECNSCKKGFNGRNGNGYQPCSCESNFDDYEKQIKHWQALKIEQLEAENKALKEALKAGYLNKTHAETLLYPEDVVARNRADNL